MTLSNWIGIVIMAVIVITGIIIYCYFRRKFEKMDGFEGFVTERGKRPRREDYNWEKTEIKFLKNILDSSDKK